MDFSSNINLNDESRVQALYASQLYGTFFGVFAKFGVSETEEIGGVNSKFINSITFNLINFKGLLNLEILGSGNVRKIKGIEGLHGVTIDLLVGHTKNSKPIQTPDVDNPGVLRLDLMDINNYKVRKEGEDFIHSNRGVRVGSGRDYLRIERKLISMNPKLSEKAKEKEIVKSSICNGVFDQEFYERDGNYVIRRDLFDFTRPLSAPSYVENLLAYGSASCPPSNNKIYFD